MHDWHFINFPFFSRKLTSRIWYFEISPPNLNLETPISHLIKKLWNSNHIYNTARYVKRDQYSAPLHTVTTHCQYIMRNKRDLLRNWYKLFNRLLSNYLIIVGHCLFYFPKRSKLTIKRYVVQVLCIKMIYRVIASANTSRLEAHPAFSDCLWRGFLMLMYCDHLRKSWFLD